MVSQKGECSRGHFWVLVLALPLTGLVSSWKSPFILKPQFLRVQINCGSGVGWVDEQDKTGPLHPSINIRIPFSFLFLKCYTSFPLRANRGLITVRGQEKWPLAVGGRRTAASLPLICVWKNGKHELAENKFPLCSLPFMVHNVNFPLLPISHPLPPTNPSKKFCLEGNSRLISLMVRIVLGQDFQLCI